MYTYNLMVNEEQDLFEERRQARLSDSQRILDGFLRNELHLTYSKNTTEEVPLDTSLVKAADGIFLFMLKRPKDIRYLEGFDKRTLESHPACYAIIDNRDGVCQLGIEKNSHFSLSHEKIADAISRGLNEQLKEAGLKIVVSPQKSPADFWKVVDKHVMADNDPIKSIKLDLLNPKKARVNGGNGDLLKRMLKRDFQSLFSKSSKLQMFWEGDKDSPLVDKGNEDALKNLTEITALCAANSFDISLKFESDRNISMRKYDKLVCMIDEKDIKDFKDGMITIGSNGQHTSLEVTLDNHRFANNLA